MKKVLIVLGLITMALSSCKKECTSSCGTVNGYGYDGGGLEYYFTVQNECSGNSEYIAVDSTTWANYTDSQSYCATNGQTW